MQFDYVIQLPSNGISDTSMGSGSGEGIRCVTDDADTDFLDRRVCFGFTEKKKKKYIASSKVYTILQCIISTVWQKRKFTLTFSCQKYR